MSKGLLTVMLLLVLKSVSAQEASVSVSLSNATVSTLISDLESKTNKKFFYSASDIDSVFVSVQASNQSLQSVLREALSGTSLNFVFIQDNVVLTTQDIQPSLPLGFFEKNSSAPVNLDLAALNFNQRQEEDGGTSIEDQLFEIGEKTTIVEGKRVGLIGNVKDQETGEAIVGALVFIEEPMIGVTTDAFGDYTIQIPQGRNTLKIRSVGMKETKREILLFNEGKLDIEMEQNIIGLKEVVVEAERSANIAGVQMGIEKMSMKDVRQVPTVLGEMDIAKIALLLPGVQSVGEGSSGFNVRGGAADQNLIRMDGATLYNPSHFFGFFSVFNPDVVKNATLLKGGIPAQYGGRISSIFDVSSREGNKRKFSGRGGISPVTARFTVEGPIAEDKASFLIGGRTTYSDWLLQQVNDAEIQNSSASFYDVNGKVTYDITEKDILNLSGYYSKDNFRLFSDSLYTYDNLSGSAQWKHTINSQLFFVLSGSYSRYRYDIRQEADSLNAFSLQYQLESAQAALDFSYFPSSKHVVDIGISSTFYGLEPGTQSSLSEYSQVVPETMEQEKGIESAIYIGDNYTINSRLLLYLGLRYSFYQYRGPRTVYTYPEGVPKSPTNVVDTTQYANNETIQSYSGPEYRASLRYSLNDRSSLKIGYNRMRQYIHMLTNTAAISPTDTWKLSDPHVEPEIGDQISLGYYRNFKSNSIETSIEGFYKEVQNIIEYKGGAQLLLNEQLETDLIYGQNRSYGVEFLIRKKLGKLNGWISYTYSRSLNKVEGFTSEETINDGSYFPANFDKPNSLNVIANYKFSRRLSLSTSVVYSTGRPITFPVTKYQIGNSERIYYSDRNEFRIPDYFRVDLSMQVEGNHRVDKPFHSSWAFSVYNLLGRDNVYSIYFVAQDGEVKGYKLSVFASAIPTITYNFRF